MYRLCGTYTGGMTAEIAVTEARAQFAELISRVGYGGEQIVLTRHGKPLVALVPAALIQSTEAPAGEIVLDLASRRDTDQSQFRLAAENQFPPPRAGS